MKPFRIIYIASAAVLLLTACGQTAGQIEAEGRRYVAISQADTRAEAAQVTISATATAVTLAAEIDSGSAADRIAATNEFLWWKSVTVNGLMVGGGSILLVSAGWLAFYGVRLTRARAIEAENRAARYVAFPLDPKTGAYPAIGVGDMLLLPNQGSNMSLTAPHEPDARMVAGAAYIQAARLIAENAARAASEGDGSGVAAVNPAMPDMRGNDD